MVSIGVCVLVVDIGYRYRNGGQHDIDKREIKSDTISIFSIRRINLVSICIKKRGCQEEEGKTPSISYRKFGV